RLDKRARILMERFAADPMASVPKACWGWGITIPLILDATGDPGIVRTTMVVARWVGLVFCVN
ncbi:MAG: hypothetical protein ABI351_01665, partial [Herbaspirillum sp.]